MEEDGMEAGTLPPVDADAIPRHGDAEAAAVVAVRGGAAAARGDAAAARGDVAAAAARSDAVAAAVQNAAGALGLARVTRREAVGKIQIVTRRRTRVAKRRSRIVAPVRSWVSARRL